jgi:DnaJ-class molecular chaperone
MDDQGKQRAVSTLCSDCAGNGERHEPRAYLGSDGVAGAILMPVQCRSCKGHGRFPGRRPAA